MNYNCNVEEINKINEKKMNLNLNFNTRKIKKIEKKGYGRVFYGYYRDGRLRQSDKLVYGYLCALAGEKCMCFPKRKLICNDLHMAENTLSIILKNLVDFGYITILKERKNGIGFQHNIYVIHGINDDIYMDIDTQKNVNIDNYTVKEKNVNTYSEILEEKNEHFENLIDVASKKLEKFEDVSDANETYNVYEKENVDEIETYSGNQNQTYSGNQNQTYSGNQNHTTNNNKNNNKININKKKEIYIKKENVDKVDKGKEPKKEQSTKKSKDQKIEMLISEYTSDCELKETLYDFLDMRKSMKKPMTFRAVKILLNKLDGIATETDKKIEVLERSILNGWQGIYELKNDQWENKKNTYNASNEQKSSSKHTTDTKTTHSNNTHDASNEQKNKDENKENDGKTTYMPGYKSEYSEIYKMCGITREQYESFCKRHGFDDPEGEVHQRYLRIEGLRRHKN